MITSRNNAQIDVLTFLDTVLSCGWLVLEDSGSPEIFLVRLPRRFIFGFPGYSTPSHNTSRPSPPISYALWNLCSTINVTLRDRVTFDDISRNLGGFPIDVFHAIDFWLSSLHTQCIQP